MTEPPVSPLGTTTTLPLPPPSANGSSSPPSSALKTGRMHTRVSGMRTRLMAAARTARITQLRRTMRRGRRTPPAS